MADQNSKMKKRVHLLERYYKRTIGKKLIIIKNECYEFLFHLVHVFRWFRQKGSLCTVIHKNLIFISNEETEIKKVNLVHNRLLFSQEKNHCDKKMP